MHQRRARRAEQPCGEAEREPEMLAIGFVHRLRVGEEQPVQGGLHGRLQRFVTQQGYPRQAENMSQMSTG